MAGSAPRGKAMPVHVIDALPQAPIDATIPAGDAIARRQIDAENRALEIDLEGFALLRERLQEANVSNPEFRAQYDRLFAVLQTVLRQLQDKFGDLVERLVAVGDWAIWGVDLRTLPYEEVILLIVLRSAERPLNLYLEIADGVFTDLDDKDILVQFQLATLPEWQRAETAAQTRGTSESLGVPLMVRR